MQVRRLLIGIFLLILLPVWPAAAAGLQVVVEGEQLTKPLRENLEIALQPPPRLLQGEQLNPLWLRRYLRQLPAKVATALEPYGYYSSSMESRLDRESDPPRLLVTVDPGEPVRISGRRLDIEGERPAALVKLLEAFPLQVGEILDQPRYEQAKAELLGRALDLGYLDADFSHHLITVDPEAHSAVVELTLAPGRRYRFGRISLRGADDYPRGFLRRYLAVQPGDPFNYAGLGRTQQQLLDSDRFSQVVVTPQREQAEEERIPVDIELTPSPSQRLRPGIGYGTDTGARLTARYQHLNLFHQGHEQHLDLLLAQLQQNFTASYILPRERNADSLFALRSGWLHDHPASYETRQLFIEAEEVRALEKGRTGSFYLRFQQEQSQIQDEDLRSENLIPGLRFRLLSIDDPVRPRKAFRWYLETRGTVQGVLSEFSMLQVLGDLQTILPLPWRSYLYLRSNWGVTLQSDPLSEVPASLRFFAGGDQSVRGYPYESLGPTDAEGNVLGGKHLAVASIEVERRWLESWGSAVFFDIGNAFNTLGSADFARGAGLGVRYYTPVGPVRFDLARSIGAEHDHYRVHFGLGIGW